MSKLKIYLCDITYDTIIHVSDTIPINIGYVGSYIKKKFGDKVEIELFKYPDDILKKLKESPPDMIALSNYSWNSNLSEFIASVAKKNNPNVVTVQGGTNFPYDEPSQRKFLINRPSTDVYAILEGEKSCASIVQRIFDVNKDLNIFFDTAIDGCIFIKPDTKKLENVVAVKGKMLERIKDLDEIPSPYLNGMLDKFFDGNLTPFLETNRGCPFTCSFCHTGDFYFHKLNKFSENRVKDEIEYIGKKAGELGITNLHLADVNFGMYPTDRKTCEFFLESKKKYKWPLQIIGTTGKNAKERVMEITGILGDMFAINMAMQSLSETVLQNVARANIKLDHMDSINEHLIKAGRNTHGELIVPLPGETKKSFIDGLNIMLNSKVSVVCIYTLMMLNGTKFQEPEYKKKFEYLTRFRIIPLNFGEYEGHKIFDYEEVGIQTKDMSFNEYLDSRAISLLVESLHNGRPFNEFFKYAQLYNIQPATMMEILHNNISEAPKDIKKVIKEFIEETESELWDSEEKLLEHYRKEENYLKLKRGEVGGNLIYKYKAYNIVKCGSSWVDFFEKQLFEAIKNKQPEIKSFTDIKSEIADIANFSRLKIHGLFDVNSDINPVKTKFKFNIVKWIDEGDGEKLKEYKFESEKNIFFEYTDEQIRMREDYFKRYGTSINAISKIVTRVSGLEGQFRKVRLEESNELRSIYKKVGEAFATKYAISN
jgi:radical SAM superfamily enzyme YgiQ (UPF0313 family)